MNKREAIQAMLEGKKVRTQQTAPGNWFEMDEDLLMFNAEGDRCDMWEFPKEGWELYEEPCKPLEGKFEVDKYLINKLRHWLGPRDTPPPPGITSGSALVLWTEGNFHRVAMHKALDELEQLQAFREHVAHILPSDFDPKPEDEESIYLRAGMLTGLVVLAREVS